METLKIVCIGNSIVNGFPLKRNQCFVSLWRQASGNEVINKGLNGDVTSNVLARFEKDVISHKPSATVVLTGTNDFIQKLESPAGVLANLKQIAALSSAHCIELILMTPLLTDVSLAGKLWLPGIDYHAVNEDLKTLRSLMLEYGQNEKIRIVDAQEKFRRLYHEDHAAEYFIDGLHPTAKGHQAIARFFQD